MRLKLASVWAILLLLMTLPAFAQDPTTSTQAALQQILDDQLDPIGPGVVLLVETPDDGVMVVSQGMADIENGVPIQRGDRFRIGSITKTFVATVLLQLQEEDELSLDDPAADYLPDAIAESLVNVDSATVRQLLNHTSGIPDYLESDGFWEIVESDPTHQWTAAEALTYAYDLDAYFEVGAGWEYSNSNYLLLELIINDITGESLAQQFRRRIFDPLGMTNSYVEIAETLPGGFTQSYGSEDENGDPIVENVTEVNEGNGLGDGGIISTVDDLVTFIHALLDGDLLADDSLAEMLDGTDFGDDTAYGLGIYSAETPFGQFMGHSGQTAGFLGEMWYAPDDGITVIALSNSYQYDTLEIVYNAIAALE